MIVAILLALYLVMGAVLYGYSREDGELLPLESAFFAMLWPMLLLGSIAWWIGKMIVQTPVNLGAWIRRKTYR